MCTILISTAVNREPLKVLGMVKVEIHVGDQELCKQWISVVPDSYLHRDLLLGCDIVERSPLTWNPRGKVIHWGGAAYQVFHILPARACVQRVHLVPPKSFHREEKNLVQLKDMVCLEPYKKKVIQVKVDERPESSLLIYPQPRYSSQTCPMLVEVSANQTVPIPVDNVSKVYRFIKSGTQVAQYEKYSGPVDDSTAQVCHTRVENDLEPQSDCVEGTGTRGERLQKLISQQDWTPFSNDHQKQLSNVVLSHEKLFMLNKQELGTISGEPAHTTVTDTNPCKSPMYRYPEHAKVVVSQMLVDMEEGGVIEPSSAAWLSPIVLVNKPDGTKRMCLDFRKVNEHLAADNYPLPSLEDLVNIASGHQYYAHTRFEGCILSDSVG